MATFLYHAALAPWPSRPAGSCGATPLAGGRTLMVSRGIGMERGNAPRRRFLCRPQLVVVEVAPGESTPGNEAGS